MHESETIQRALRVFDRQKNELEDALVEAGPSAVKDLEKLAASQDPSTAKIFKSAIERINKLRDKIEKLVNELDNDDVKVREQSVKELAAIGRPARSYVANAAQSKDPEVRYRARFLLTLWDSPRKATERWLEKAQIAEQELLKAEQLYKSGAATASNVASARKHLLHCRFMAAKLPGEAYLREARELASSNLQRLEEMAKGMVVSNRDVMKAKLELAYADCRLGKISKDKLYELQSQAADAIWKSVDKDAERELSDLLEDPFEDLDQPR